MQKRVHFDKDPKMSVANHISWKYFVLPLHWSIRKLNQTINTLLIKPFHLFTELFLTVVSTTTSDLNRRPFNDFSTDQTHKNHTATSQDIEVNIPRLRISFAQVDIEG